MNVEQVIQHSVAAFEKFYTTWFLILESHATITDISSSGHRNEGKPLRQGNADILKYSFMNETYIAYINIEQIYCFLID
jgi:hypothetical protein